MASNLTHVVVTRAGHMVPMDVPDVAADLLHRFVNRLEFNDKEQSISNMQMNATDLDVSLCYMPSDASKPEFLYSLLLALTAAFALSVNNAQVPIPGEPPGFTIGQGSGSAGVQLETYIDLLCPYSKTAYAGVKALASHYKPDELRVKAILFPLPFHQYGFTTAESVFTITSALGDDQFAPWLEVVYENQESFWNEATKDRSAAQVTNDLKDLAQKKFSGLTDKQWEEGMTGYGGTKADEHTRVAWKYACTRTITGTPQYTLNGVHFEEADSSWGLEDWIKAIDPLVQANKYKEDL
ncbi:hypothetical protein BBJ29_003705 [Phytophthora kernoviae]|uniref:Thioredoxin-like fold domain-containing protein n=1 Tax=Phytophthora kernoviae TaxID=325452 RepID=A0A3R7H0C6_9STRA|nr:hypothetical protein BBJ29_003705 [Phytophthora kernoviae]